MFSYGKAAAKNLSYLPKHKEEFFLHYHFKNVSQLIINHQVKHILCINFPENCKRGYIIVL